MDHKLWYTSYGLSSSSIVPGAPFYPLLISRFRQNRQNQISLCDNRRHQNGDNQHGSSQLTLSLFLHHLLVTSVGIRKSNRKNVRKSIHPSTFFACLVSKFIQKNESEYRFKVTPPGGGDKSSTRWPSSEAMFRLRPKRICGLT